MTDRCLLPLFLLGVLLAALPASAQSGPKPFVQMIAPLEVQRGDGSFYLNPFSGGLLQPRIGLRDADRDGDPDLFTLNPDNRLRLYRNEGALRYRRILPSPYDAVPVRSWFRLADIDGDGDDDIFSSGPLSEVLLYRNTGTATAPLFSGTPEPVRRGDTTIYTQQETVPSLVDIDADGDLDLFSGNLDGSITFYRNIGSGTEYRFTFITSEYQGIRVVSGGITEREEETPHFGRRNRHGASVLDFADLDGDTDLDMLFGDFFTPKLLLFHNDGTRTNALFSMSRLDTAFRPNGDDVTSVGFNQPVAGDPDGDGDLDVLVSSLYPQAPEQPVVLYENTSGSTAPVMRRNNIDLTSEIDLGTFSAPCWIEDREHLGALIGASDGSITYMASAFMGDRTVWRVAGRFGTQGGLFQAVPAAGDLDGDGNAEIIVGDANDGRIRLFRFQGNRLQGAAWQLDTFKVNQYAAPSLADIDRDGDLDLFVGAGNGLFIFFQNIGTPASPLFERRTPPSPFNTLDIGSNSAITFADLDYDGDPDAVVGGRLRPDAVTGTLRFYLNTDGTFAESPALPEIVTDRNPVPMIRLLPEGLILFAGVQSGGLTAYVAPLPSSVPEEKKPRAGEIRALSNTLRGDAPSLGIVWNLPVGGSSLLLTDLLGRPLTGVKLPGGMGEQMISLPPLSPGIYLLLSEGTLVEKIMVLP